ncbi:FAD-dependent oxidoreductase [Opitutaceae bacterium TAV3]|nr:FAD-dependent oxidoreductase [Opitutaceae bacterium TAV3]
MNQTSLPPPPPPPIDINMETIAVDLVVIGSTPGGIACAVRAAREGLRVLLTNYHNTLGGMISGGLGGWESICEDDARAPIYTEMRRAVFAYYRDTYGEDSPQYRAARYKGHGNGHFEPVVGKRFFTEMVQGGEKHHAPDALLSRIRDRPEWTDYRDCVSQKWTATNACE